MPQSPSFANPSSSFYDRLKAFESGGRYNAINYDKDSGLPGALGAYQFRAPSLAELGYLKSKVRGVWDPGNWTGKGGINSYRDFLDNRQAQDDAAAGYVRSLDTRLWTNGTYNSIGQTVDGQRLTREGLLAAGWVLPGGIGIYVRNPQGTGLKPQDVTNFPEFRKRIGASQDFPSDPQTYLNPGLPVPSTAPRGVPTPGSAPQRVIPPGPRGKRSDAAPPEGEVDGDAAGSGDDGSASGERTLAMVDPAAQDAAPVLQPGIPGNGMFRLIPVDHDPFAADPVE